jgi:hypothetical protein
MSELDVLMSGKWDLCSFASNYARSRRFMLVHGDLCSPAEIYARSRGIYARPFASNYARSQVILLACG